MIFVFLCLFLGLGLAIGFVSGLLGIGGGILLIPGLMWMADIEDQRKAAGITLAVLTLPVVLPAAWQYVASGFLEASDLGRAAVIALGFAVGAFLGAYFVTHERIPLATVRFLFGLMLIFVAVRMIIAAESEVTAAVLGLFGVACAWLAYVGLRALGRHHLTRPHLAAKIQAAHRRSAEPLDYSI